MEQTGVKAFLKRKNVNITVKTYLIDAMGAMAFGLFASLLIGTIFGTLGDKTQITLFQTIANTAKAQPVQLLVCPSPMPFMRPSWFFSLLPR